MTHHVQAVGLAVDTHVSACRHNMPLVFVGQLCIEVEGSCLCCGTIAAVQYHFMYEPVQRN